MDSPQKGYYNAGGSMNLKKLAEAIGRQRVLLHIEGIGIREIKIYNES